MLTIIDKCNKFDFFDGNQVVLDCIIGTDYYFGRSFGKNISESYIQIADNYSDNIIDINVFGSGHGTTRKYISNFQPPKSGFDLEDLIKISEILNLQLVLGSDNIFSAKNELIFKSNIPYDIVILRTITGGRQPEGVTIDAILYVSFELAIKQKYFNCT